MITAISVIGVITAISVIGMITAIPIGPMAISPITVVDAGISSAPTSTISHRSITLGD
jgi:hypothetical protein